MEILTGMRLVNICLEAPIRNDTIQIHRQMIQDLERQVSERLLRPLDHFARIGNRKCNAEIDAPRFPEGSGLVVIAVRLQQRRFFSVGVEVLDELFEVGVMCVGLEAETVFERLGEGDDEIQGSAGRLD